VPPQSPPILAYIATVVGFMTTIQTRYRSLSLLLDLNWDRMLYAAAIAIALLAGSYLGSL